MNTILNLLWIIFGGLLSAIAWSIAGVIMAVTIIGLPWTRACFTIANYSLFPFGRIAIKRSDIGRQDIGTGTAGMIGNVIWFVLAGWWLFLAHLVMAVGLCLTIIGIPFGFQHWKIALISLSPIGKIVIDRNFFSDKTRQQY